MSLPMIADLFAIAVFAACVWALWLVMPRR